MSLNESNSGYDHGDDEFDLEQYKEETYRNFKKFVLLALATIAAGIVIGYLISTRDGNPIHTGYNVYRTIHGG